VFVAMPFGKRQVPGGDNAVVEVDFDAIYDRLLRKALEKAGCDAFRADEERSAGDIRTDMFFELATADFVLADISSLNANVFYELGVRQGVAERGVILIHDERTRAPFDIAPDRRFKYRGELFVTGTAADREEEIAKEVEHLAAVFRGVIETDPRTQSSPVYKELQGLRAPDVRTVKTARARYFDAAFEGIGDRVKVARKKGLAGDILTLADESPNGLYRSKLLFMAGRSLIDLKRFDLAKEVLEEQLKLDPDDVDASSFLGLALNRLRDFARAEVHIQRLTSTAGKHPDANGALGRIYKDQWRLRWEPCATLEERRQRASDFRGVAESAMHRYGTLFLADPRSYYNGINFLAVAGLLEHLGVLGADATSTRDRMLPLVRTVTEQVYEKNRGCDDEAACTEYFWAAATLGELRLLAADGEAPDFYRRAATAPGVTHFAVDSMLDQVKMYESLAFAPKIVTEVRRVLDLALAETGQPTQPTGCVVFASGHMIDKPGRSAARFPADKEPAVRLWIKDTLAEWGIGDRDVVICGGARGTDLLAAEVALERGARVELHLAHDEGTFLRESVDLPGANWRMRFFAVRDHERTGVRLQADALGLPPPSADPYTRNNRWMLNTAWVQARDRKRLRVLLVWDGKATGDGPGGTSHAAGIARDYAGDLRIADPMAL
jgi:tetratricopeptide (TPR) repeat protein